MLTTVQGLGKEYDAKKVLKAFKKVTPPHTSCLTRPLTLISSQEFACNGTVVSSEEADEEGTPEPTNKAKQNFGQVIQLQGDQRAKIREFLISTGMVNERDAKEKIQVCVYRFELWGTL
jgi:translation initiation factor 1